MKGNKLGDKAAAAAKSSSKGNQEGRQAWKRRRQRQPRAARMEIMKGDKSVGDKAAAASRPLRRFRGSATQSLRSKNPCSFQLSGE